MGITRFNKHFNLFTNNDRFEEFKTLEELYQENGGDAKYLVTGVFTFKSAYGDGCFVRSEKFNITLPTHLVSTIEEIRNDEESIQEINGSKIYIKIYPYKLDRYPNKIFYSVNFIKE